MNPINLLVQNIMLPFLIYSYHHIYPNYGVSIILLTLIVKIIFYPLTHKQFKSLSVQKEIQPEIKEIQEKFKGQPEKLQKEMTAVWKKYNMNPLSGCLPTLIQLPVFIAVFYTIKSTDFLALIAEPGINPGLFSFWLSNLGQPDTTYILPIFIGIITYITQKLMTTDPKQAKIFAFMPFLMVVICLKMPAGVLLYWAASQGLSAIQQILIMKKIEAKKEK